VHLVERGGWHFQTAPDLAHLLRREREEPRRLSRAAVEALAIIAYHEPVSRAEIEAIRGVQTAKGTLDVLMEAGWVRIAGRREVPGRPTIYATTPAFLAHFGLTTGVIFPGSTNCGRPGCSTRSMRLMPRSPAAKRERGVGDWGRRVTLCAPFAKRAHKCPLARLAVCTKAPIWGAKEI
jgi:hypothetical protein